MNSDRNGIHETAGGGIVPPNFSEMLDKVLANPEIISTVAAALSKGGEQAADDATESVDNTLNEELPNKDNSSPDVAAMMQRLPDVMKVIGPLMSKGGGGMGGKAVSVKSSDKRACLLTAIKPYLNPQRCEAIDYIIRFSELSELIKKIH